MAHYDYPLHVIHSYSLEPGQAASLAAVIAKQSRKSLTRLKGVSRRRMDVLPYGAVLLDRLIHKLRPKRIVFSAYGLREGLIYDTFPKSERDKDPLIEGCIEMARAGGRFAPAGDAYFNWMKTLFGGNDPAPDRLRRAAAWLADIAGLEHPDYRGEHAFFRVLRIPAVGIDHPGRAFLALAIYARYEGDVEGPLVASARALLGPNELSAARTAGLALRLAIAISAGSDARLRRTMLRLEGDRLVLVVPAGDASFGGEMVRRRLEALAEALSRTAVIEPMGPDGPIRSAA